MQLECGNCGAPFRSGDLNFDYGIATCRFCKAVTKLPQSPAAAPPAPEPAPKPRVPQPRGVTVEEMGGTLRIVRRWFSPALFFLLFFCIAWDSFLLFWYSMALGGGDMGPPFPFNLVAILFPLVHVAVGVALTYATIAGFLNSTVIEADGSSLSVLHGPVPWPGNGTYAADEVEQLYCQCETKKHSESGTNRNYKLHVVLKDGTKKTLLSHVTDPDQARFIEQKLEEFLRIADRPVAGEFHEAGL